MLHSIARRNATWYYLNMSAVVILPTEKDPWEQLPDEGNAPYKAFQTFLEAGPGRTLMDTANAIGRHEGTLRRYSSKYKWMDRARAWDRRDKEALIAKAPPANDEMYRDKQLEAWDLALELAVMTIRRTLAKYKDSEDPPTNIKDALALLEKSTTFQRLIMGYATARDESSIDVTVQAKPPDLSSLPLEDAERFVMTARQVGLLEGD